MQNDIVTVKKPPASAISQPSEQEAAAAQTVEESSAPPEQVTEKAIQGNNLPVGIITAAIIVCVCLIAIAVYSALAQA